MRFFTSWKYQDVEKTFGIIQRPQSSILDEWLSAIYDEQDGHTKILEKLRLLLLQNVEGWNEEELKMKFIGPLLNLIEYDMPQYKSFFERRLSTTINKIEIGGIVDMMIASGYQYPLEPYFCLHEYKPELGPSSDPRGQLLIEMLTVQHLNKQKYPIYGAYIKGRNWFFVVLDGNEYAVSLAYDATKNELYQIYAILKQVKAYIERVINSASTT